MFAKLLKFLLKIFLTPILFSFAIIFLLGIILFSVITVPIQILRYTALATCSAIYSSFSNEGKPDRFLDEMVIYVSKICALFPQVIYIMTSIWIPPKKNKSNLKELSLYQIKLLSKNWFSLLIISISVGSGFGFGLSAISVHGLEYFELHEVKEKLLNTINPNYYDKENKIAFEKNELDSLRLTDSIRINKSFQKKYEKSLDETKKKYNSELSNLRDSLSILKENKHKAKKKNKEKQSYKKTYPKVTDPYRGLETKVVIYSIHAFTGKLHVWIDNTYVGEMINWFNPYSSIDCNDPKIITANLTNGWHSIVAKDHGGQYWSFDYYVNGENCSSIVL